MPSPVWMSRDLNMPEPPIVAGGVVFVLSSGEDVQQVEASGIAHNTAARLAG
jgi:hypothetical protein